MGRKSTTNLYDVAATIYPGATPYTLNGVSALSGLRAIMATRKARKLDDGANGYVHWTVTAQAPEVPTDATPDAFTFTDQVDVVVDTVITSAPVTLAGLVTLAQISVTGGSYSINGGAYVTTPGQVKNGDVIRARHTSAATPSTATNTVVTVGGVSDTFTSTTAA